MLSAVNNSTSLNAQANLNRASSALSKTTERLSSGLKINRGADGPAALVISEKQRAQIAGLRQAIDNSDKAVSVVQTAEGSLNEINSLLVKVRSLAIDSANTGVNDADALAANQAEIANALETINRIANNTQFGTKKLLDGSGGIKGTSDDMDVSVLKATSDTKAGTYAVAITTAGERANVAAVGPQVGNLATDETLTVNGVAIQLESGFSQAEVVARINDFSAQTGVTADISGGATRVYSQAFGSDAKVSIVSNVAAGPSSSAFGTTLSNDTGVNVVGTIDGDSFTGKGNVLTATSGSTKGLSVRFAAAGADAALTVAAGAQGNVTVVDNSLVFQIGANANQTAKVAIGKVNTDALGVGVGGNQFNSLNEIDVTSASKAQDALGVIDSAIADVTNLRGTLGAFQTNTLQATAANLQVTLENTVAAESVIRDTNFAEEIANLTKNQVLVQAGASVLKTANQQPQLILSLLQ